MTEQFGTTNPLAHPNAWTGGDARELLAAELDKDEMTAAAARRLRNHQENAVEAAAIRVIAARQLVGVAEVMKNYMRDEKNTLPTEVFKLPQDAQRALVTLSGLVFSPMRIHPSDAKEALDYVVSKLLDGERFRWLCDFAIHHEDIERGTPYVVYGLGMGDSEPAVASEIRDMVDYSMARDKHWLSELAATKAGES
ncbi:hypothetical protein [Xanthomonas perforans]|uniref:hypothetical protein n=1 Tax=Xanthomonas perforans TaxID=442694 RepID=UPI002359D903|nr:hypothetical protein [Xanthomonas perforans]MDC9654381.1 hypothetical protein [Xanthomonas perforans]